MVGDGFTNVDPATEADVQSRRRDPREVERSTEQLLTYICTELIPYLSPSDVADAPTILTDAHLRPKGRSFPRMPADSLAIVIAISNILEVHSGPTPYVHLTSSHMSAHQPQLLTGKGIQDLVLINRPWPLDVPLPAAFFNIAKYIADFTAKYTST